MGGMDERKKHMARCLRQRSSTGIYHVMLRGVNKQDIFDDSSDYSTFLNMAMRCREIDGTKLFAFCLMKNHVHLLIKEGSDGLSSFMHRLAGRYAKWYNKKNGRVGYLFQDRFKSEAVEDDSYLITVIKYIHYNPVKAGICSSPMNYKFSSFRHLKELSPAGDCNFAECIDFKDLFEIIDKDRFLSASEEFTELDHIKCLGTLDTEDDRRLMSAEDALTQYMARTNPDFRRKETREKKDIITRLYEQGLSIRKISRITATSATYISRLLWAE